jgi:hypothetical protein
MWDPSYPNNNTAVHPQHPQQQQQEYQHQPEYTPNYDHGGDMGLNIDFSQSHPQTCGVEADVHHGMQHYTPGLETLFEPSYGVGVGDITGHNGQALDYQFNDMVHEYH